MKQLAKRMICLLLGLILLGGAALASEAYGPQVYGTEIPLGEGTALKRGLFWSEMYEELRAESYITYTPNDTVVPVVDHGTAVCAVTVPAEVEARLRQQGLTMVGGVNGDYFVMATGENLGLLVTEGVLRTTEASHPAVGFFADGTALIGTPDITVSAVSSGGTSFVIDEINKANSGGRLLLFTGAYGPNTGKTEGRYLNVTLTGASEALTLGGSVTAVVTEITETEGPTELTGDKLVLSLALTEGTADPRRTALQSLQPGELLTLTVTAKDSRWHDVVCAVGGMYLLVKDGQPIKGLEVSSAPRTAVGRRADGTLVFYTSASYSDGAPTSLDQVAVRLTELGCETAILLDGGGSTTLSAAYPGSGSVSTVNTPSAGKLRRCSNYLVLASTLPADGEARSLWVYPYDVAILSGAEYTFTARAADQALRSAPLPGDLNWFLTGSVGTLSRTGTFTAGAAGEGAVGVSGGGLADGAATVRVVTTPDVIRLTMGGLAVEELTLATGDSVALTATAYSDHVDLVSQNDCFVWELEGIEGSVNEEGVLEVGKLAGEGVLTVSAGGTSVSVPIHVRGNPFPDMVGHWAVSYTTDLYDRGLIQGVPEDGVMNYQPDRSMTRAQFAVLMANVLRLDPAAAGETELPFADRETIPDWALAAVRAVYAEGLMMGSAQGDALYFEPYEPLSRAEGVTVIGRAFPEEPLPTEETDGEMTGTLPEPDGTAEVPLPEEDPVLAALLAFPDGDQVPSWAREHFASLIGRNVINGLDGTLAPQSGITRAQAAKMLCVLLAEG